MIDEKAPAAKKVAWLRPIALLVILVAVGFILGRITAPGNGSAPGEQSHDHAAASGVEADVVYTCSMHPQVRLDDPNAKCPICAMDLIPVKKDEGEALGPRMMRMSRDAMKLAEIETCKVERRFVELELPMVGKVDYDETRVKTISAWMPGRLDRLFVDYTGVPVRKGEHLVEMYSPELYAAQEELIQALKAVENTKDSNSDLIKNTARATVEAAREKLKLLGLATEQIEGIEKEGAPSALVEIKAPIGGIVIEKNAREGMYVKTGEPIYTVADLSRLWVLLDAYESDLPWIRYGQEVDIRTEAFGDKVFPGWISFIDPVLDPRTRTVKVRVIVENPQGELRPNMFARAVVKSRAAMPGQVLTRNLEGKFICPMHPEIIKDGEAACDECGMDLVRSEELGYVSPGDMEPSLVVPASAVLTTGKRALVYVRLPDREEPTFEGVEVELGPRAGDHYLIRSGLEEGQEVVVHGNFKIDSALQLMAKPSMMSPDEEEEVKSESMTLAVPDALRKDLAEIFGRYLEVQQALGNDDAEGAAASAAKVRARAEEVETSSLSDEANAVWKRWTALLDDSAGAISQSAEIQKQRERFVTFSRAMESLVRHFGPLPERAVRRFFCPMAFNNKGGYWLQEDQTVLNPYFGSAMLRCGEMKEVLSMPDEFGGDDGSR
ncbi:MAG: efflux RND transporter periplasmic adaptor subunit [Planctomycetota bacterium]